MIEARPQFYYVHAGPQSERVGPFPSEEEARAAARRSGAEVAVILRRVAQGYLPIPDPAPALAPIIAGMLDSLQTRPPAAEGAVHDRGR